MMSLSKINICKKAHEDTTSNLADHMFNLPLPYSISRLDKGPWVWKKAYVWTRRLHGLNKNNSLFLVWNWPFSFLAPAVPRLQTIMPILSPFVHQPYTLGFFTTFAFNLFNQLKKEREEKTKQEAIDAAAALPRKPKQKKDEGLKVYKSSGIGKYLNPSSR